MSFPLIPIVLAALWAVACHREEDTKSGPLIIGPEPMPRESNTSPHSKQTGEKAVETYFNKLCQGYFSNKQDQPQQFCSRLWRNQSLPSTEQKIRDKVFSYATLPLSSDLDPKLSYQELKIRPILEEDLGKVLKPVE